MKGLSLQWRIQDLGNEGTRPLLLVKGGGAHHISGLNWGLKMTNKLLTTGETEGARAPAPPSKSATAMWPQNVTAIAYGMVNGAESGKLSCSSSNSNVQIGGQICETSHTFRLWCI